jgi:ArsR family metal-binding transcriptional regulator
LSLIDDFEIELSTPDCDLESQIYKASVIFDADITEALPYVNAIVEKAEFIPGIPVLVWTEDAHKYALRPREIAISNITERREAGILARKIVDRINSTWEKKDELEPSYESYERPKVLDILKLLPRTNCKECGLPTCMAFADSLAKDKQSLEDCPAICTDECAGQRTALKELGL